MDILNEIEALKREYMAPYAMAQPQMANVTLRLLGHVLGEYGDDRWTVTGRYQTLTNAHLLRILHGVGIKLKDRWNYATAKPGGNLRHVLRFLLDQFQGYDDERAISGWSGADYWDDCYIALALIEARRDDPGCDDDPALLETYDDALRGTLKWMAEHARANFPNASDKEWFGPGFHAAALQLFHVVARENLDPAAKDVIDAVAVPLQEMLEAGRGKTTRWDSLFAWHIGQVVTTWCQLSPAYPSLMPMKALVDAYYQELIGTTRRTPGAGWTNGGRLDAQNVVYGTARALAAAYAMNRDPDVIDDAHAFITAQMEEESMLQGLKARVNILETLQMKMECRLPNPELHLALEMGARLTITGLYEPVLKLRDPVSARNKTKTLLSVRNASRDALERSGTSALQPLGVSAELLNFVTKQEAVLKEFHGPRSEVRDELKTFLSATMTEIRARAARSLLRKLWTRRGLLYYVPFFDCLAELEHLSSFFADYRDHVNHQILVFLLGTYMFYNDARLRDALLDEIARTNREYIVNLPSDDSEFLFRWKMASTFHDVGYIFEVSPTDAHRGPAETLIAKSVNFINEWIDRFLVDYLIRFDHDEASAKAAVKRIEAGIEPYATCPDVDAIFPLRHSPKGDAFATSAGLLPDHLGKSLLRPYFDLCRTVDVSADRARFLDHGIMSAAVLLKTADVQHHHLTALRKLANQGLLAKEPELSKVLLDPTTDLDSARFFVRFAHAAGAIALHNVYPTLHGEKAARDHGLEELFHSEQTNPRHFHIALDTPLAFLLAIADGLQDWDRHSFRSPSIADRKPKTPLSAHEILLAYDQNRLAVLGLNSPARKRCLERLTEMKVTLRSLDDFVVYAKELR